MSLGIHFCAFMLGFWWIIELIFRSSWWLLTYWNWHGSSFLHFSSYWRHCFPYSGHYVLTNNHRTIEITASTLRSFVCSFPVLLYYPVVVLYWHELNTPKTFSSKDFLFPKDTHVDHMKVCEQNEMKLFCKDYVERAEVMFILATVSCALVILSLVSHITNFGSKAFKNFFNVLWGSVTETFEITCEMKMNFSVFLDSLHDMPFR